LELCKAHNESKMKEKNINQIKSNRIDYNKDILDESNVDKNPLTQFESWLGEAIESNPNTANCMTLATVSEDEMPTTRVVLLRDISFNGFTFFTNYESRKAKQINHNPKACINFFWPESERQVRVEGLLQFLPQQESDSYFNSRPFESKVGAWVSKQSKIIESRSELDFKYEELLQFYAGKHVPRPANWGGYVLIPTLYEFWQGRPNRLHDRIRYTPAELNKEWKIERISP
jgi:pyridoxamine 5'-phosphate oxidase